MKELFAKIVNDWKPLTNFIKISILLTKFSQNIGKHEIKTSDLHAVVINKRLLIVAKQWQFKALFLEDHWTTNHSLSEGYSKLVFFIVIKQIGKLVYGNIFNRQEKKFHFKYFVTIIF